MTEFIDGAYPEFAVGKRVRSLVDGRVGTVERINYQAKFFPWWVRWDGEKEAQAAYGANAITAVEK